MQAVILAAGYGKRLKKVSAGLPKPMVRLKGKPILEYVIEVLPEVIDEVIIVVGYKKEVIKEYFGDYYDGRVIRYAEQPEPKGTADALYQAEPLLRDEEFLCLYGDNFYSRMDILNCIHRTPTILVRESKTPERYGVCLVSEKNELIATLEKRENPPSNLVAIGVQLLNKEFFDVPKVQLPSGEYNLTEQIGLWAKRQPVQVIRAAFWQPVDYPENIPARVRLAKLANTKLKQFLKEEERYTEHRPDVENEESDLEAS